MNGRYDKEYIDDQGSEENTQMDVYPQNIGVKRINQSINDKEQEEDENNDLD